MMFDTSNALTTRSVLRWWSILIGVVCIICANLLLEWLRTKVDLPLPDLIESSIAAGVGVLVWFAIMIGLKR